MEERKKIIPIIIGVVVILLIAGLVFYFVKIKGNDSKPETDSSLPDNYVEDKFINLDEVLKKDRVLIQTLVRQIPYKNGLYQNIYDGEEVKIDNIRPQLLFNMSYNNLNEIKEGTEEYNKIKKENSVLYADYFIKKQDIIDNIKKLYNVSLNDLPSEIDLVGGDAKGYKDYYGFVFASEPGGLIKISKIVSYTISNNSVVIYEKPAFYEVDMESITLYSDANGKNKLITLEPSDNIVDTLIKNMKENLSKLDTYEHIFKKENNNYYWSSISATHEGK